MFSAWARDTLRDTTAEPVFRIPAHGAQAEFIARHPGGELIATCANDGVLVWSVQGDTPKLLYALPGQKAAFSTDGSRLVTVDGSRARVFIADPEDLIRRARLRACRTLTPAERERFADLLEK